MKNKVDLKRCMLRIGIVVILFAVGTVILNYMEYQRYCTAFNQTLHQILGEVRVKYPEVSEEKLIEILNRESEDEEAPAWLLAYGIDYGKESLIQRNEKEHSYFQALQVAWVFVISVSLTGVFLAYNRKKDKELANITRYIEEINHKNYKLEIDDMSEDELSILKNEIYKTTVMLKEVAEHSMKAKNDLKESLSDISHQLKTPLTSISIILDNLMDDPQMPEEVRMDFIHDAQREIRNINFLVQSLLKLSKLDSNTIVFRKEEVDARKIVDTAIQNVAMLCDLKNIAIEVSEKVTKDCMLACDFRWQVEAITNILKNSVEHAPDDSKIEVDVEKNKVYVSISIRDFGEGIDEEDQKHLFERFYKGKNASQDSVGIGLALAKAIVETEGGCISVTSGNNGTTFTVKYSVL